MEEKRIGRQSPTHSFTVEYSQTHGQDAIDSYEMTGRTAQDWQKLIVYDMLAIEDDGLWSHDQYGFAVPRQNGKNECISIRELWALENGEKVLHTAHRTTTSHTAWERLCVLLDGKGYKCAQAIKKDDNIPEELLYDSYKALGLEYIVLRKTGGKINFRTRSSKGGIGESYDVLCIDEAQEYTIDMESALKYVIAASPNPQIIYSGTPPTPLSAGTVFKDYRQNVLHGALEHAGWAEWAVDHKTDPSDVEAWYQTNPSLGTLLSERTIKREIGGDEIDFNVQRLGYWVEYNQQSLITEHQWTELKADPVPQFTGKLHIGIKFGTYHHNATLAVCVKTTDDRFFVEVVDCRPAEEGIDWIIDFLRHVDYANVVIDGASGQQLVVDGMKQYKLKRYTLPQVREIITANALYEQAIHDKTLCHGGQNSLMWVMSNCDKRNIGSNGGFGFKSLMDDLDISLLDACMLAHWSAKTHKVKSAPKITY